MDVKVQILKSSEDDRLQLVVINGSIFAIVHSSLDTLGPIRLLCEDWSLVLGSVLKRRLSFPMDYFEQSFLFLFRGAISNLVYSPPKKMKNLPKESHRETSNLLSTLPNGSVEK